MKLYMDFSAILAIATMIAGGIWLLDALFFKARRLRCDPPADEPKIVDYARSFFPILLIVFILRAFLVEPFRIPSGSMKPSLLEGDFILVNKFSYGFRLPLLGTKLFEMDEPKRGDIVIFRNPQNTSIDYIKRVIGVPGDKIRYQDKTLYVNGKPLEQTYLGKQVDTDQYGNMIKVNWYKEASEKFSHSIFTYPIPGKDMDEITVPEGEFFMMGDNRDNSGDSREWGFVPENLILGKAFLIWMSWDADSKDVRWKRLGKSIDINK